MCTMSLQKYFNDFNAKIKMDYQEKAELADKRDILVEKLKKSGELPSFTVLNQGSYSVYTGIEPLDKEYDIDVGLRFNSNKTDFGPMELKNKIYKLLENHTDYGATIKRPCVTISYKKDGEIAYHVDLVVYTYEDKEDSDSQMFLARGKEKNDVEVRWEKADPKGLVELVNKFSEDENDREQYRRIIRFLKRWKNLKFDVSGNAEPPSIGLTLIAAEKFVVSKTYDCLEEKWIYDDLNALINFTETIQSLFTFVGLSSYGKAMYKIKYYLPANLKFEKETDIFKKMTDIQMTDFKEKVDKLKTDLIAVRAEADEIEQCKLLNKIFGNDFQIPLKSDASKKQFNYIPLSSSSGRL